METYRQRFQVFRKPRRMLPRGPQPQNWQTNIQKVADLKNLEVLLADGCKAEAFRIGGPTKFPPVPVELENIAGLLHFAYAGSTPNEEEMRENGIIVTQYATYYQGIKLRNVKPKYQEEILKQVLESWGYQGFKSKYERKIKLRGMHSD